MHVQCKVRRERNAVNQQHGDFRCMTSPCGTRDESTRRAAWVGAADPVWEEPIQTVQSVLVRQSTCT